MLFFTSGSEAFRIDSSGRVLVGATSARENYFSSDSGQSLQFQIEGTDYKNSAASFTSNSTSAGHGPHLAFGRSRGTSIGSNTIVNDGDTLGTIVFHGNDGSKFVQCARIDANVVNTNQTTCQVALYSKPRSTVLVFDERCESTPMVAVVDWDKHCIFKSSILSIEVSSVVQAHQLNINIKRGEPANAMSDAIRFLLDFYRINLKNNFAYIQSMDPLRIYAPIFQTFDVFYLRRRCKHDRHTYTY